MVQVATGLVALAIILVFTTLGAVLLVRFVLPDMARASRVLAAGLGGPVGAMGPFLFIVALEEGGWRSGAALGLLLVLAASCLLLGWPVAHFATRRLDRLTRFDSGVFE